MPKRAIYQRKGNGKWSGRSCVRIDVDFGMIQEHYGRVPGGDASAAVRYSPATITRRFTRLTNGFSKKLENHVAANALHFLHYKFARIHQTLRVTPAMAAGVSDDVWSLKEIVGLLDNSEAHTCAA